jgi:hypothetical protein
MVPFLDIFKIDPGGRVLWCGVVASFVAAKARIQMLTLNSLSSPGEYLILDLDTAQRVVMLEIPTLASSAEDLQRGPPPLARPPAKRARTVELTDPGVRLSQTIQEITEGNTRRTRARELSNSDGA